MAYTSGTTEVIAAPADIQIKPSSAGTYATIGELAEGGASIKATPNKVKLMLENGKSVIRTVSYNLVIKAELANFSPANLTELAAYHNSTLPGLKIKQTVAFGATNTGREAEITDCHITVPIDTKLDGNEFAKLPIEIEKDGASLSEVLSLTNLTT